MSGGGGAHPGSRSIPESIQAQLSVAHCHAAMPVVWGEMDALGHVNNVVYFRYLETARVEFCRRAGLIGQGDRAAGLSCILHSVRCRFRRALVAPDEIWVTCTPTVIEVDRVTLAHKVLSRAFAESSGGAGDPLAAEGEGTVVCYDYNRKSKSALPDAVLRAIEAMSPAGRGASRASE